VSAFLELQVEKEETASTAVSRTISPETALRAALLPVSAERERARVREAITATDAASPVTSLETAPTPPRKVHKAEEAETVSVAENSVIWPEIAPTLRPALREDQQDKATASNAASPVILLEIAELNIA
jgi:hypothetical protein